jgi:hypothetical protein
MASAGFRNRESWGKVSGETVAPKGAKAPWKKQKKKTLSYRSLLGINSGARRLTRGG